MIKKEDYINNNVNGDSFRNNNLSSDNIDDKLIEMIKLNKNDIDFIDEAYILDISSKEKGEL